MTNDLINKKSLRGDRLCVGCNKYLPKTQLIKITARKSLNLDASPITIDWKRQIPGRSAYIYPSHLCLDKFIHSSRRKSFGRLISFNKKINPSHLKSIIQDLESNFITNMISSCPADSLDVNVTENSLQHLLKGGCPK